MKETNSMRFAEHIKNQNAIFKRAMAFFLAAVTLFTSVQFSAGEFSVNAASSSADGSLTVCCDGEPVDSITLPEDEKRVLSVSENSSTTYQWQIRVDKASDLWVNISGQTAASINLGYATVGSLLDESGNAYVRCRASDDDGDKFSEPVKVSVAYVVREISGSNTEAANVGIMELALENALPSGAADYTGAPNPGEFKTYSITVEYLYAGSNKQAYNPYVAQIAAGESFSVHLSHPEIVGYLAYVGEATESSTDIAIDVEDISENIVYTVWYKPTKVKFTVKHYLQNILDDHYELSTTTEHYGYTDSLVDGIENEIDGFSLLYYDRAIKIAADGSTEVEVYYDRNYYLAYFDLNGGYGTEPVYARYGSAISADTPKRAGYLFGGWKLTKCGKNNATAEQESAYPLVQGGTVTLPSMNLTYQAIWVVSDTHYTVVYWTENADDDGYSFLASASVDTKSAKVVNGSDTPHTWDESKHFTLNEEKSDKGVIVEGDGSTIVNVYYTRNVYTLTFKNCNLICTQDVHVHSDDCCQYGDTSAIHSSHSDDCCTEGKIEHKHNSACVDTDNPDFIVSAKYEADIAYIWETSPIKEWRDSTCVFASSDTGNWYSFLLQMPGGSSKTGTDDPTNIDLTKVYLSPYKYTWYYWLEVLPGTGDIYDTDNYISDGERIYKKFHETVMYYSTSSLQLTYTEDYFPIVGFSQKYNRGEGGWKPAGGEWYWMTAGDKTPLYYYRNQYDLKFNNYGDIIDEKQKTYYYEQTIGTGAYFEPDYPSTLPAGAYEFEGWYTTAGFYEGTKVDFTTMTMPAHDVELYAHWVPKKYTVRVFQLQNSSEPLQTSVVEYNKLASAPSEVAYLDYVFAGWFYMDGGEKKAWAFNSMTVTHDIDIFAEWKSKVQVTYTVRYQLADGTEIASPTVGTMLAGMTKTFPAKTEDELYAAYRESYYPNVSSHAILMTDGGDNTFTFVYMHIPNVPYTVRYINKSTGEKMCDDKVVNDNSKAVVTEIFVSFDDYVPDAYQKRLVLTQDADSNVITFYYHEDTTHAFYMVTHWVQKLDGSGYYIYKQDQQLVEIGSTQSASALTLVGYKYIGFTVNNGTDKVTSTTASGQASAENGLRFDFYYDRLEYRYTVRYLKWGTENSLLPDKTPDQVYPYGSVVYEDAKIIAGYDLVSAETQARTIRGSDDVITFYYKEQSITISYVAVGGGRVSNPAENLGAVSGYPQGSTPTAYVDWAFDGWYKDEGCTVPVAAGWVNAADGKLTPQKENGAYRSATYYAKFVKTTDSLTIKKSGAQTIDENQTFIFRVVGNDDATRGIDITVTVHGNGTTTITDLPLGSYTVTERSDWSWRYDAQGGNAKSVTVARGENNQVEFVNERNDDSWLGGDSYENNIFNVAK